MTGNPDAYDKLIFLKPHFMESIWGGTRLSHGFSFSDAIPTPVDLESIGECWAISAHSRADLIVSHGTYAGLTLSKLWDGHPELFGYDHAEAFPLLIKYIDAAKDLSIQVHPDETYAQLHEDTGHGKRECWYIIDAPHDASIIAGLCALDSNDTDLIYKDSHAGELSYQRLLIKKGDFVVINPGCVHALTAGVLALEIQQASDITYRIYDYDRKLPNGTQRELQREKAQEVIKLSERPQIIEQGAPEGNETLLVACDSFVVRKYEVTEETVIKNEASYSCVCVIEGEGFINGVSVSRGCTFIASALSNTLTCTGNMTLITANS